MAKTRITRTYGPIHFEDLDAHRFEDLIRELIYDYKDWQTIEGVGRTGGDEGFDIRAYGRIPESAELGTDEENVQERHPMMGDRWMIQCKREKTIGPTKLSKFLDEIDASNPPYGYILAASTDFSKKSYDAFREKLIGKGVMEFYLWGKPELEDMLHLPKNDRILFTFFGVSLVSRRRSRSTEIRFAVNNKNKLFRIFGDDPSFHTPVLMRDSKDDKYPYGGEYKDFEDRPRWRDYPVAEHHPLGLVLHMQEYFAYVDVAKKEFDFSDVVSRIQRDSDSREKIDEQRNLMERVEDFWDHLMRRNRAIFHRDGLVRFEDMLVIDDKGDAWRKFPHIYVDFGARKGPFSSAFEYVRIGRAQSHFLADWNRIKVFPDTFPEPTIGKVHLDRVLDLDSDTLRMFVNGNDSVAYFFDVDGKYEFLAPRDIIGLPNGRNDRDVQPYAQIT